MNGYSPLDSTIVWQQYTLQFDESNFYGTINSWSQAGINDGPPYSATLANQSPTIVGLSGLTIPAGYQIAVALNTDAGGNVLGAAYSVSKNGTVLGTTQNLDVANASGYSTGDLAPIVAFQAMLVGPSNGETVTFSSGAATLTFSADAALTPTSVVPPCCPYTTEGTGESANTDYQNITVNPAQSISQSVTIQTAMAPKVQPSQGVPHSRLADWQALQKKEEGVKV